jgi:hypothetical protein
MLETSQIAGREIAHSNRVKSPYQGRAHSDVDLRDTKKKKAKYRKRRTDGLCGYGCCSEKAEPGRSQCQRHLQKMSERAQERRNERIAGGLCISCGERPQFWGRHCILCRKVYSSNPLPYGARRALRLYREAEARRDRLKNQREIREAVLKLLASGQISEKSAEALRLYAGIEFVKWRTYEEVGKLMNLSRERVRQLLLPLKHTLNVELSCGVPWRTRKRFEPANMEKSRHSPDSRCPSCDTDAARILKDGSCSYEESGLPNVVLFGVPSYHCEGCDEKVVSIPCKPDLHGVIAEALIQKPGLLTGSEGRFLREFTGLSALSFAAELGVSMQTLLSWERLERLRYRDDLCVRIIGSPLSKSGHACKHTPVVAKAIRDRNTEPYEIRAGWLEEEKRWSLISI